MPTINLPDGHSAVLRDDEVRRSDARFVARAADHELQVTGDQKTQRVEAAGTLMVTATMQDAIIARFVSSWTLTDPSGQPLPITLETVQDLPMRYFKPLAMALRSQLLEVQMGVEEEDGQLDPTSAERLSRSAPTA